MYVGGGRSCLGLPVYLAAMLPAVSMASFSMIQLCNFANKRLERWILGLGVLADMPPWALPPQRSGIIKRANAATNAVAHSPPTSRARLRCSM